MKEEKHLGTARSRPDGVVFYSNLVPGIGITSIVSKKGEIIAKPSITFIQDFLGAFVATDYKVSQKAIVIFNLCVGIATLIIAILSKNFWFGFGMFYFLAFASKNFLELIPFAFKLKFGNERMRSLGRFHAAEHQVKNAYRSIKEDRVPTKEEVMASSRFSKYCGSVPLIRNFVIYTALPFEMIFLGGHHALAYTIALLMTITVLVLDIKFNILRFMQVLVTNKPTDLEIDVAMEGFRKFLELENKLENADIDDLAAILNRLYIFPE